MAQGRNVTFLLFLLLLLLLPTGAGAQRERDSLLVIEDIELLEPMDSLVRQDSVAIQETVDSLTLEALERLRRHNTFVPDPTRALWLSLVFPGAGQIYNRKYWKLPVIYGGFLGCAYALSWNNQMLRDYSQAYLDIMDDDPTTKSYEKMLPMGYNISGREEQFKNIFKNKKNYYRKYRDMSIFAFAAVYAIAVIDAYVDAELSTFDISEDLSLEWAPAVITTNPEGARSRTTASMGMERGFGMAFRLTF